MTKSAIMKHLIFLLSFLTILSTYAQRGGQGGQRMGGGRQGGQSMGQQERENLPEFDAAKVAGIFSYNDSEAIKKMKLKKDENLKLKVRRVIAEYNMHMDEISLLNTENFDTINVFMNTTRKYMRSNGNRGRNQMGKGQGNGSKSEGQNKNFDEDNPIRKMMHMNKDKIDIVKAEVLEEERLLNSKLESLLSEKQYKKWIKYQNKIKKDMAPVEVSNNRNQNTGMRGVMNRGQGGRPGGGRGGF